MKPLDDLLGRHPLSRPSGGKDDKGAVVVIGGPPECPGAALLTGTAALRAGAGRVQLCVAPTVRAVMGVSLPEIAVHGWQPGDAIGAPMADALAKAAVVVIGVGYRDMPAAAIHALAHRTEAILVLDAGAIGAAPELADRHSVVIAPNVGEAQQLTGLPDDADEAALVAALRDRLAQPVAVRGGMAVLAADEELWYHDKLPAGLGTPGSGDVFMGALAALLGNGFDRAAALGWAIWSHAQAASQLAAEMGAGYLASEIARRLPNAMRDAD